MTYYRENIRRLISQRAGDWLVISKHPRLLAGSAIVFSLITFAGSTFYFKTSGVKSFGLAFTLASCLSYASFLLILAYWIHSMCTLDWRLLRPKLSEHVSERPGETEFDRTMDHQLESAVDNAARNGEGVLEIAMLTALFGIIFVSIHYIYHAPYYLGQLLFDSGKISHRTAPKARFSALLVEPIRQSWMVCVVLIINFAFIGLLLDTLR
jgi:hypothetical protein